MKSSHCNKIEKWKTVQENFSIVIFFHYCNFYIGKYIKLIINKVFIRISDSNHNIVKP